MNNFLQMFCEYPDIEHMKYDPTKPYHAEGVTYATDSKILIRVNQDNTELSDRFYPLKSIGELIEAAKVNDWQDCPGLFPILKNELYGLTPEEFEANRQREGDMIVDCDCVEYDREIPGCDDCEGSGKVKARYTFLHIHKYHKPIPFGNTNISLKYLNMVYLATQQFPSAWRWQQVSQKDNLGPIHFKNELAYIILMPMKVHKGYELP